MDRARSAKPFALALALLACACKPAPGPVEPVAPAPAEPEPEPVPEAPVSTIELLPTQYEPGWAVIPRPPKALAVADYRLGLEALERGEFEAALAAFDDAYAHDPSYHWARHGRGQALAALGRQREALPELFAVLEQDLPSFGALIAKDELLADLRAGDYGEALDAYLAELELAYAARIASGVPAWTYVPRSAKNPRDNIAQAPWEDLRLGVLDPDSGRFVPLSPALPLALGGVLDRGAGRALLLSGEVAEGDMHVMQARDVGVHLYDLADLGVPIIDQHNVDDRHDATKSFRRALAAAIDPNAPAKGNNEGKSETERARVRVTYFDLEYGALTVSKRVAPEFTKLLDPERDANVDDKRVHVRIDHHGVGVHEPLSGVQLADGRLSIEGREQAIELPPDHAQLEADRYRLQRSTTGRHLMVFSQRARCGENGEELEHALTHVNVETGVATLLVRDAGLGNAEMSAAGWIYYGRGEQSLRFAPGSSEAQRDLLEDAFLALPGFGMGCGA